MTPQLRFPEFRDGPLWNTQKLDSLVDTVSPPKRLQTTEYLSHGAFPIIDQSQNAICGWTNDADAIIREPLPLVIFGDHTCVLKLADKPFAQGADGIKILRPRHTVTAEYLYYALSDQPLSMEEYRRHFAILKERYVSFPPKELGEQQKIAACLTSLDELIAAQGRKVEALKAHKKGLMQHLFPREGETRPRLRFPEFRKAGEWEQATVGSRSKSFSGGTPTTTNRDYYGGAIPFIRSAEIAEDSTELTLSEYGLEHSAAKMVQKGDVLVALYGANSGDVALCRIDGAINQAVLCLRPAGSSQFLYHALTERKEWILNTFLQGGQGNLSGDIVKSIPLRFPSPAEQSAVALCLTSLDELIEAAHATLSELRKHKTGLMQQLFPRIASD